jgi:CheY-like chemotaxis protein
LRWSLRDLSERQTALKERKQAQEKIKEQAALLDVATDAIFVCDFQKQILFWNKAAERLYGWMKEEVLGKNIPSLLYRGNLPQLAKIEQEIFQKKGTQFQIFFPAEKILTEDEELKTPQSQPKSNGTTILIVDDEPFIRQMSETFLKSCGYKVLTAKNGTEAIALFADRKDEVSAVLMDMMMPSLDGKSAIAELKKIDLQVKILVTSGLDLSNDGIGAFLRKPYTVEELAIALNSVISNQ